LCREKYDLATLDLRKVIVMMTKSMRILQSTSTARVERFYRNFRADTALGQFGVNAIVEALSEDIAVNLARESDKRIARNQALSAIDGAVITVKDTASLPVSGWSTSYGSRLWPYTVDRDDAPCIVGCEKLVGIVIGGTTLDWHTKGGSSHSPALNYDSSTGYCG
jgi:Asp-tRNA(Asn)/Glu-tRNA(Gln) amidotransferase A subunit family amidase